MEKKLFVSPLKANEIQARNSTRQYFPLSSILSCQWIKKIYWFSKYYTQECHVTSHEPLREQFCKSRRIGNTTCGPSGDSQLVKRLYFKLFLV